MHVTVRVARVETVVVGCGPKATTVAAVAGSPGDTCAMLMAKRGVYDNGDGGVESGAVAGACRAHCRGQQASEANQPLGESPAAAAAAVVEAEGACYRRRP